MNPPPLIAIFGAAVRPDGRPSDALLRRIDDGLRAAIAHPDASIFCTGGAVRPGPTEASVMSDMLTRNGVDRGRLVLDEASLNTLQNVAATARQAKAGGHPFVIACSDGYHMPRIRLLLAVLGVGSHAGPTSSRPPLLNWIAMSLREAVAIPHNLALAVARRRRLLS